MPDARDREGAGEPVEDPIEDDVARGLALMQQAASSIVDGVERLGTDYVVRVAVRVLDAYGPNVAGSRDELVARIRSAAQRGTARVVAQLRELFDKDPAAQRATPMQVVRTLPAEATAVLAVAGIPAVARDAFDERTVPNDSYGLAPRTLGDLGDADLGPMLLAWGMGKALTLRGTVG